MPVLDYKRGDQEGRHRILAAKRVGETNIPVLIVEGAKPPAVEVPTVPEAVPEVKRYIIKKEPEPLYPSGEKYVAYRETGEPRYLAAETEEALKARLLEAEPSAQFVGEVKPPAVEEVARPEAVPEVALVGEASISRVAEGEYEIIVNSRKVADVIDVGVVGTKVVNMRLVPTAEAFTEGLTGASGIKTSEEALRVFNEKVADIPRMRELIAKAKEAKPPGELECMICHNKFDHLIIGTCESCYKKWTGRKAIC
ncbi:hypothetical protein ES703_21961 [subsurface metagenome]